MTTDSSLELPLRAGDAANEETEETPLKAPEGASADTVPEGDGWFDRPGQLFLDIIASIGFWYFMLFVSLTNLQLYMLLGGIVLTMVAWRLWRLRNAPKTGLHAQVPYTTGVATVNNKELLLVATLHISPRAPQDVERVITDTTPDVVMIELDEERLDRMRHEETVVKPAEPAPQDLQQVAIKYRNGGENKTVYAQRALWNGDFAKQQIRGELYYDASNPYGLEAHSEDLTGKLLVVQRGGKDGQFAPFALKAFKAAEAGAAAVLCVNSKGPMPVNRIGGSKLTDELRLTMLTRSCGHPPLPVLMLPHDEGSRLCEVLEKEGAGAATAEFEVMEDHYPRRGLAKRLCQGCALFVSGIGVLYGIIQCFAVEVGGEFLAAEVVATAKRIPCVCVDVDLNRFWSRLGWAVIPTPCNVGASLIAWFAFPRILFRILFPADDSVDIPGSMVLHGISFPLRTWVAFILAGFCASFITTHILGFFCTGAEQAAEGAGVVHTKSQQEKDDMTALIMLGIEMYMFPRIYEAVAASRDEAMYRSIVEKGRAHGARRMVVVAGAGHANGILQRVRTRGL
eukprot:TRINITY_DN101393_c0_g1_i1.p1 TRINITY_DN101393_c0_g1~~TRINITY_DN101393_c0_g1_i1.p1  ORF type:complete len:568 (-),score=128.31 TRINITY_DN101393_c0_g1_i1:60-1763(-)